MAVLLLEILICPKAAESNFMIAPFAWLSSGSERMVVGAEITALLRGRQDHGAQAGSTRIIGCGPGARR
jgi:hypothetical protein